MRWILFYLFVLAFDVWLIVGVIAGILAPVHIGFAVLTAPIAVFRLRELRKL